MPVYPSGEPNGLHVPGKDLPTPIEARGFSLYHFCLRIKDPVKSLAFYHEVLGMRTIFSMNCGSFSIYYIGCYDADETVDGAMKNMFQRRGMIELLHRHGTENDESFSYKAAADEIDLGFGHLGYCVRNLPKVAEHLKAKGVEIIKPQGVATAQDIGFPADMPAPLQPWIDLFKNMIMIRDPDGYYIELVPEELHEAPI